MQQHPTRRNQVTIEKTKSVKPENNLVMIVYGKGGVGKTTFAASVPNVLILDFENGTKYLGQRGFNVDVVRMKGWFKPDEMRQLGELMKGHDAIVIDPLGEAMEKLINSPYITGKQYRQGDGSLTLSGWGEVKRQMRNFIKFMRDSGKHVIIVSHVSEVKTDQGLEKRIQVATGLSDEIPNMVDVISYLGVQKNDEAYVRALYTPTQGGLFDSKDRTGRIPMVVEVGEHSGWQDLMNAMGVPAMPATPVIPTEPPKVNVESEPTPPPPPAPPETPKAPTRITAEQSQQMRDIASRMSDVVGKNYLLRMAVSAITFDVAQEIINRASASLGGA